METVKRLPGLRREGGMTKWRTKDFQGKITILYKIVMVIQVMIHLLTVIK